MPILQTIYFHKTGSLRIPIDCDKVCYFFQLDLRVNNTVIRDQFLWVSLFPNLCIKN